jgi:prepilin-type N-terminal cleavage/methylation domain-containing protein
MIRRRLQAARRQDGYTLTEMMVVIGILGLLFAAFAMVLSTALRHGSEIEDQSDLQGQVRPALDRFAQDFRQAYTGDDTWAIESIGASQVTFLSPDRQTPFHLRRVSYRVSGGNFQRAFATSTDTDGAPWTIPALGSWSTQFGNVVSSTAYFRYYDEGGTELNPASADVEDVRTVKVRVLVATATASSRQVTYETSASVRAF